MATIRVENIYKIFGPDPGGVFRLIEEGKSNKEILEQTGHTVAVADVSFEAREGETLVVMGLSGSGKSTLLRCINRLIEPTRGKAFIGDTEITALDRKSLMTLRRKKFGMVFQNFALFPYRSVTKNVEYGLEIQGIPPGERREKATEALKLVGLEGWENAMPSELSGGMQQRVGLARGLAVDPEVLLMDEAFSALDPLIRRDMQHELISLQERMKKTIIFITHDLSEAVKLGDRIILMKDGRVVQAGTAEEILTAPATRYVEQFVEEVDMSLVLTARSVMQKARAVAFPGDGPRTALHKMGGEGISSIFVVQRDYTLVGIVKADDASEAAKRGDKTIEQIIIKEVPEVQCEEPVTSLISMLATSPFPVAVVDEARKLLGVVVKGSLLAGLAEGGGGKGGDTENPPR